MRVFILSLACCLWFVTGCASHRSAEANHPADDASDLKIPGETTLNPDAGRGNLMIIGVRINGGKPVPFVLDTGAGITCVSESLATKLGKPVGTVTAHHWGHDSKKNLYAMPKISVGGARLRGGEAVMAMDLSPVSLACGHEIGGILGMDVLENYCLQLDFDAHKLRFPDHSQVDKSAWGRAFPVVPLNDKDARPAVAGNLFGEVGPHSLIDSGYDGTGWLMVERFDQWTNHTATASPDLVRKPNARFFGEAYTNTDLDRQDVESDGIGVKFLARHLVTLDFPNRTLYLKRTSIGPLPDINASPVMFLKNLKERGQLPGWSKDDHGEPKNVKQLTASKTVEFEVEKQGESALYHYRVTRGAGDEPWRLSEAWRTDVNGHVLERYPVPGL